MNQSASSIEEITSVLAPLTPLGRHLLSVIGICLGSFALLFGKKCLKITLFLIGFCTGFCIAALICHRANAEPNVLLIVSAIVGILLGLLSACVASLGKIVVASSAGFLVTLSFTKAGVFSVLEPSTDYVVWLILVAFILICIWITSKFYDIAVVIVTSVGGSLLVVVSIIHFIPDYNFNAIAILSNPTEMPACNTAECIGAFVLWSMLSLLGMFVQWRLFDTDEEDEEEEEEKELEMVDSRRKTRRSSRSSRSSSSSVRKSNKDKSSKVRRGSKTTSSKKYKRIGRSSTIDSNV